MQKNVLSLVNAMHITASVFTRPLLQLVDAGQLTWPTQHRCNKSPLKLVQESGTR
jgi:hypothetical protein